MKPFVSTSSRSFVYFGSVPAGFESLAVGELREKVALEDVEPRRGWIRFQTRSSPEVLLTLRSFFRLYALVGVRSGIPTDEEGLHRLKALPAELEWDAALELWRRWFPLPRARGGPGEDGSPDSPAFRVTVRRTGEHAYNSQEAAGAMGAGVQERFGWPVDLEGFDLEVFGQLVDGELVVGLTLTPASLHFADDVDRGRTGLKVPVAHGLVRLADPQDGEVVVDPMGGVGTIPIEAARYRPAGRHLSGEIRADDLAVAARNVQAAGVDVRLFRWDARGMPLADGTVDCVISDLPFGLRVGSHRRNRHLYPAVVRDMARVVRPGGRAVLLTIERRLMNRVIQRSPGWSVERTRRVHYGGLEPQVYVLRRKGG